MTTRSRTISTEGGHKGRMARLIWPRPDRGGTIRLLKLQRGMLSAVSKKNYPIMPLDKNPHQIVTRFGRIQRFSMDAYGFSVPQMLQFCLFTYPPRSKRASSEKMILFGKIGIFCKSLVGPLPSVVQAYTQPYSFGVKIKLIICQIRHELSVTIHKIY